MLALRSPKISELFEKPGFLEDLGKLERSLGRQIVGFPTTQVRSVSNEPDESALYDQEFMMYPAANGERVGRALQQWSQQHGLASEGEADTGIEVMEFLKWTVGESESA